MSNGVLFDQHYVELFNNINSFFGGEVIRQAPVSERNSLPINAYDVKTSETGVVMTFELPGVKKADLSVQADGHKISISGKRNNVQFHRYFGLGKSYDPSSVSATLDDGLLTFTFNKFEQPKTKAFTINVK